MKEEKKSELQLSNEALQEGINAIAKKIMILIIHNREKMVPDQVPLHMAELQALIRRAGKRFQNVIEDLDVDKREQESLVEGLRWERALSAEAISWYRSQGYNLGGR